jgi:hypothetical protein
MLLRDANNARRKRPDELAFVFASWTKKQYQNNHLPGAVQFRFPKLKRILKRRVGHRLHSMRRRAAVDADGLAFLISSLSAPAPPVPYNLAVWPPATRAPISKASP